MTSRVLRIRDEAALAAFRYSTVKSADIDDASGSYVVFHGVSLPEGYNKKTIELLFLLPPTYPFVPPDWFYCDPGLRIRGMRPRYYHEDAVGPSARPSAAGWAGACLHFEQWRPSGDLTQGHSLLSCCELVWQAFCRWRTV